MKKGLMLRDMTIMDFDAMKIRLASPEDIRNWSYGEVKKPETINYRTHKPERDGLFCARIFGPIQDYQCLCGKYKKKKYKGTICEKCGVEVTVKEVRRERLGHIELAAPVAHIWYYKGPPSRIGLVLDIPGKEIERIVVYDKYVVLDPGDPKITGLKYKQTLTEEELESVTQKVIESGGDPNSFRVGMGAEALKELLEAVDIDEEVEKLREAMLKEKNQQKLKKISKRLALFKGFKESGVRPEWMIMTVIPVLPPDLRPLVKLDGGRFGNADLNELYKRVINRNNRLKKMIEANSPELILRNEKRLLQQAVDALFDNSKLAKPQTNQHRKPFKSLSDNLRGKQGRFRQNLLGKRVDFSGRSVIVVGPELKLHQAGLPKKMALELFKPFIAHKLEKDGLVTTVKVAEEWIEQERPEVWDALDEVIREHPILLNRAPTLHRLGIQAFEPVLIEGKAIRIHPLVCPAFNADFDGDQMAVHVPISMEAQAESLLLMLSSRNILSPAHGKPLTTPTQDMVLGIAYLTMERPGVKGTGKSFNSKEEVILAYSLGKVHLNASIYLRYTGELLDLTANVGDDQDVINTRLQNVNNQLIQTTVGRVIFNDYLSEGIPYINGFMKKKGIANLINYTYLRFGLDKTVDLLDRLKEIGFHYSTISGVSIGIDDMVVPSEKEKLVAKAHKEVMKIEKEYMEGLITKGERLNKLSDVWHEVTEKIRNRMFETMAKQSEKGTINPLFLMSETGARGSKDQISQLAGIRGLMAKPSGEIIETPITSNFREGLSVAQYFISTHGARKGMADTALKTSKSGYLTRRIVDVAQDVTITMEDCGTIEGLELTDIEENGKVIEPLEDRIIGRISMEDVKDPETGEIIVKAGDEIDEIKARRIIDAGIERVKVRAVLTCQAEHGICQKCYGRNMATGGLVELGEAVGIIAAQSIGEPGTQLTMRTRHTGGIAMRGEGQNRHVAKIDGTVKFEELKTVVDPDGNLIVVTRLGRVILLDHKGRERVHYNIVHGSKLFVKDGQKVHKGDPIAEWDPYTTSIISEVEGFVKFIDINEETLVEERDEVTGKIQRRIILPLDETKRRQLEPQIQIVDDKGKALKTYLLPVDAHLMVNEGDKVYPGTILVKKLKDIATTKDITEGLPRAEELFEARHPKFPAIISEISGIVKFEEKKTKASQRVIKVVSEATGEERSYKIPKGVHIIVHDGDRVRAGDPLIEGHIDPRDILSVLGEKELAQYLLKEVQKVYRPQGVKIHDKHIEVIIRQMLRWVIIEDVGDTDFIVGQIVDKYQFQKVNEKMIAEGKKPARGKPHLLGISRAALNSPSFISAASFQETSKVLAEAAIHGKVDYLKGIKENVILGRIVPAGTGFQFYKMLEQEEKLEEKEEKGAEVKG